MDQIKHVFSPAGFVWDAFIPSNPDTGYAHFPNLSSYVDEISLFSHHTMFSYLQIVERFCICQIHMQKGCRKCIVCIHKEIEALWVLD